MLREGPHRLAVPNGQGNGIGARMNLGKRETRSEKPEKWKFRYFFSSIPCWLTRRNAEAFGRLAAAGTAQDSKAEISLCDCSHSVLSC